MSWLQLVAVGFLCCLKNKNKKCCSIKSLEKNSRKSQNEIKKVTFVQLRGEEPSDWLMSFEVENLLNVL